MKKKSIYVPLIAAGAAIPAVVLGALVAFATGNGLHDGPPPPEIRAELHRIIEEGDYGAWKEFMHERIDSISEEEFKKLAGEKQEMMEEKEERMEEHLTSQGILEDDIDRLQELVRNGEYEKAEELRVELGLPEHKDMWEKGHKRHGEKKGSGKWMQK